MMLIKWLIDECADIYDSPADFAKCSLITVAVVLAWGLFMGLMGEYR